APSLNTLTGTDPSFHAAGQPGAVTLMENSIRFAASGKSTTGADQTGLYFALSCYYDVADSAVVHPLFRFGRFVLRGNLGCYNDAHIVASSPVINSLTDAALPSWGCSVHEAFAEYPSTGINGFQTLATAEDILGAGSQEFADGTIGLAYIISRGATPTGCGNGIRRTTLSGWPRGNGTCYSSNSTTPTNSSSSVSLPSSSTLPITNSSSSTFSTGIITWSVSLSTGITRSPSVPLSSDVSGSPGVPYSNSSATVSCTPSPLSNSSSVPTSSSARSSSTFSTASSSSNSSSTSTSTLSTASPTTPTASHGYGHPFHPGGPSFHWGYGHKPHSHGPNPFHDHWRPDGSFPRNISPTPPSFSPPPYITPSAPYSKITGVETIIHGTLTSSTQIHVLSTMQKPIYNVPKSDLPCYDCAMDSQGLPLATETGGFVKVSKTACLDCASWVRGSDNGFG
ncbi:hypothetical protein LTS18_003347, partial [Coniosporium uncinatum]